MLQTEDVDVDLFTPAAGTSLATIFNKKEDDEIDENASLKYVPETAIKPFANDVDVKRSSVTSQCLFATSVLAYEWIDKKYLFHENLGIALIKTIKDDIYHLVLYTSNKKSLSMATISSSFIVTVTEDASISYYDNFKKYWLICAANTKITEITYHLEKLQVKIKHTKDENNPPVPISDKVVKSELIENESDTDSSTHRKNKQSLLKRMATMGQSVLPQNKITIPQSTDSSDCNDSDTSLPMHKAVKSVPKRHIYSSKKERSHSSSNPQHADEVLSTIEPFKKSDSTKMSHDICICNLDFSHFISEHRISNTELRINVNKLSDKVDLLLDKTISKGMESYAMTQQNEIVNKLLKEYERKIMVYENFIKCKGLQGDLFLVNEITPEASLLQPTITPQKSLQEQDISKRDCEIEELKLKIKELTELQSHGIQKFKTYEDNLLKEINTLKEDLRLKNELLNNMDQNIQNLKPKLRQNDYSEKLKSIMNITFQMISANFEDDNTYPGLVVKNTVAKVIKKATIESLHENVYT